MQPEEILINQMLQQQSDLTAVEEFALRKDLCQLPKGDSRYSELIPKKTPGPGQQYAFEVNLDQCTGCKACVTACHNENGLDEEETWRSVGLLHGKMDNVPAIQHVTSACHHCLEPACMHGCPVNAYEKDPATGIVKHLDDQCFGCQYCTLKCPYDVPKYSKKKGIVHKCDMCISRLKVGEAPACVRSCPNEAIRITLVDTKTVRKDPDEFVRLPQAPGSSYTLPTTKYVTTKKLYPDMTALDQASFEPQHPHVPLVVMLVLTQLSVGAFLVEWLVNHSIEGYLRELLLPAHVLAALGIGLLALAASIFHLGRPLYAFRAVLGFKRSWLSREIIAFGVFAKLAVLYAVQTKFFPGFTQVSNVLGWSVILVGIAGVLASVMVYRDTHRVLWDSPLTTFKFLMTAAILGITTIMTVSLTVSAGPAGIFDYAVRSIGLPLAGMCATLSLIKIAVEASLFLQLRSEDMTPLKKSALLMTGPLRSWTILRFVYGFIGGVVLPMLFLALYPYLTVGWHLVLVWGILAVTLFAEMLERYLFFRAVVPLRMPGVNEGTANEAH